MKTNRRKNSCFLIPLAVSAFLATIAISGTAAAKPAFTWEKGQIQGGFRFGTDNLDFGVGVRGGYTLGMGLYLGGAFDYWFGDDDAFGPFDNNVSFWDLMFEAGYDFGITPTIMVRPFGGLGVFHAQFETCNRFGTLCDDASDTDPAGEFGGIVEFAFGAFHLGPELRVIFANDAALIFGADFGGHF